jgi:hypothetical protein
MNHKPFRGLFVILSEAKDLAVGTRHILNPNYVERVKMLERDRNVLRVFEGSLASLGMTTKEI